MLFSHLPRNDITIDFSPYKIQDPVQNDSNVSYASQVPVVMLLVHRYL